VFTPAEPNDLLHEGTKRHEEHEALLYKIILRDLRGFFVPS